jgi:sarcosine oxidase subunit alpha
LASQSGNKTQFKEEIDAFIPGESKQNEKTLGAANGIYTLDETLKSSFEAGNELSKKITNNENKVSFQMWLKRNQQFMINFGVFLYQKEKIIKDF